MSPKRLQEDERSRLVQINGPRPSPLRISKESQVIHKPSSYFDLNHHQGVHRQQQQQQQRKPVIIYTHSPKIIHTKPRDFMALVQKLTGFSKSEAKVTNDQSQEKEEDHHGHHEDNDSSSISSDENNKEKVNLNCMPNDEIPLFTPNSTNLFFSPQGLFRQPMFDSSPSIGGSFSPSFLDFFNIKELPEY